MASGNNHEDDDYVAKLLSEDARKASLRYAAVGLQALLPKRWVYIDMFLEDLGLTSRAGLRMLLPSQIQDS